MADELFNLRLKLEEFVKKTLGGKWYGSGYDHTTGEVDFSFDLGNKAFSVHILELKRKKEV